MFGSPTVFFGGKDTEAIVTTSRVIRPASGFNPITEGEFVDSPDNDCRVVILTSRDVTVIRKMLEAARWPTRYGRWLTPKLFEVVNNSELVVLLEELEVKLMGCDIAGALSEIASAILALAEAKCNPCESTISTTNGGVNGTLSDGTPTYGTVPYSDRPEGLPDGYTSQEQYNAQRCAIAHLVVDGMVSTLRGVSTLSGINAIGGTILLILATASIIVMPEVMIPMLVTGLAASWAVSGGLLGLSVEVEAHRQELVCTMLMDDNLDVVISVLGDLFGTIVEEVPLTGVAGMAAKSVLMLLCNSNTLNQLYGDYAGYAYPTADCSGCGSDLVYIPTAEGVVAGTLVSGDLHGGQVVIGGVNVPWQGNPAYMHYRCNLATVSGKEMSFNFSISNPGGSNLCVEWLDSTGSHYLSDVAQATQPLVARVIQVRSEDHLNNHYFEVAYTYE